MKKVKKYDRHKFTQFYGVSGKLVLPKEHMEDIEDLIFLQCSAKRAIYNFLKKDTNLKKELYQKVKPLYPTLSGRYFNAVVAIAEQLPKDEKVIFGGKYTWQAYVQGHISRKTFLQRRNNTLYSQAHKDSNELLQVYKTKEGQCFLRIKNHKICGGWWDIPFKCSRFNEIPLNTGYSVRLTRIKDRDFKVDITWGIKQERSALDKGCFGVDVNPRLIAWSELDAEGNLLKSGEIVLERVTSAKSNKRENDIVLATKHLVSLANKPIVIEKLNFGKGANRGGKRFNRMVHNFAYRKIITQIKRQAAKKGVPVKEVQAAYTSVLGITKYAKMYKLNRHTAASFVIGRRGLKFKERVNFLVRIKEKSKPTKTNSEDDKLDNKDLIGKSKDKVEKVLISISNRDENFLKLTEGESFESRRKRMTAHLNNQSIAEMRLTDISYERMLGRWCKHSTQSEAYCLSRVVADNSIKFKKGAMHLPRCHPDTPSRNKLKTCNLIYTNRKVYNPTCKQTKVIIGGFTFTNNKANAQVIL